MLKEFKKFAMRGNVMDMAVGIIIGAAFGLIVKSFVSDILMPPIGMLLGGVTFTELKLTIQEASADVPAVTINYGAFLDTIVNFLIIAFSIFMVIKVMNKLKKEEEEAPAAPPKQEVLLEEIRDLLKKA